MNLFKSSLSRLVSTSSPQLGRWYNSSKGTLPCAAAVSIGAAFACLGEHDHAPDPHASDTCDRAPAPCVENTLPPDHPDTVRVRRIAANLISAARDDELFGGRRLSERMGHRRDKNLIRACSSATGDIRMSTGYLELFLDDDEIASVLAHEVAHVIARPSAKMQRKLFWVLVLVNFVAELLNVPHDDAEIPWDEWLFLFVRPLLFRTELEADRVGLMLQAAAGYDPRASPRIFETVLSTLERRYRPAEPTHPPSEKGAALLRREDVMGEALEVFHEARAWRMPTS